MEHYMTGVEYWKDVDEKFLGRYEVSSFGRLRNKKTSFIRKPTFDTGGYDSQIVFIGTKATPIRMHRAVAIAFIPNPEHKPYINHKNGIRHDNRIENLEWCTSKENSIHALYKIKGEESHFSILSEKEVIEILLMDETVRFISEKFGISTRTVTRIKRGKIWKHVYNITPDKVLCKLSWKINLLIANKIRADHSNGDTIKTLCVKYSLSNAQISLILMNKRWKI